MRITPRNLWSANSIRELYVLFTVQFNTQSRDTFTTKMSYLQFISCTLILARIDSLEITVPRFPSWTLILASTRNNNTCIFNLVKIMSSCTCFQVYNKNSFSCHVDFVVNQICRFTSTKKKKPRRNSTVACHRHLTEKRVIDVNDVNDVNDIDKTDFSCYYVNTYCNIKITDASNCCEVRKVFLRYFWITYIFIYTNWLYTFILYEISVNYYIVPRI